MGALDIWGRNRRVMNKQEQPTWDRETCRRKIQAGLDKYRDPIEYFNQFFDWLGSKLEGATPARKVWLHKIEAAIVDCWEKDFAHAHLTNNGGGFFE